MESKEVTEAIWVLENRCVCEPEDHAALETIREALKNQTKDALQIKWLKKRTLEADKLAWHFARKIDSTHAECVLADARMEIGLCGTDPAPVAVTVEFSPFQVRMLCSLLTEVNGCKPDGVSLNHDAVVTLLVDTLDKAYAAFKEKGGKEPCQPAPSSLTVKGKFKLIDGHLYPV